MNKLFAFLCVFVIFSVSISAQQSFMDRPSRRIEDDSSLRFALMDSWLKEVPSRVLNRRAELHTLQGGSRIQVRTTTGNGEFGIVLARELQGPLAAIAGNSFPGWAQGSWILTRRISDGAPIRIRIFLRSDPNMYVQFTPFTGDKSQMDVVLYNAYVVRSLPIPVAFERLLALPVEEALALAGARFPRQYFDPEPDMYLDTRAFIEAVRSRLPQLQYTDDGAIDENGRYVYIETLAMQEDPAGLNCSGFAKWIVDGILKPHTRELLPITPLKLPFNERNSSFTEPWEEIRDPYFGLDWIRNLGSRAGTVLRSPAFSVLEEFEVRARPFSQIIFRQNGSSSVRHYPGFLPDIGYGFEGLYPLLYTLAINEPGRIYLAAVNNEVGAPVTAENQRGLPRMRQYYHIAVLVPYFNEYGDFRVTVFESAAET